MISIIVYGRNDNHGYNLPKRAAISLNCIAEVLNDQTDEIIFIDYNTPDDLPTFPEAIADTLTGPAKARLRVIRVRPRFHQAHFAHRTHLGVLESISRNIALRRANPANRWVLSTNTDMIFVPNPDEASLSRIAARLADGFYHLPRFELPEALWEGFDRTQGAATIERLRSLSRRYHLDEIVYGDPRILYDGPGDFQLCLRQDLLAIDGFDEDMLLGWHVDSNLAVRLAHLRGGVKSAADSLRAYHCDHTRQPTILHAAGARQNDLGRFMNGVTGPFLPGQRHFWGFPHEDFEEIRLGERDGFVRYRAALDRAIDAAQQTTYRANYTSAAWGKGGFEPDHVLPYAADLFANLPPASIVALWLCSAELMERLLRAIPILLPAGRVMVPADAPCAASAEPASVVATESCRAAADVLVFECPGTGGDDVAAIRQALVAAFHDEGERLKSPGAAPRRFVVLNAVNSPFEAIVATHLDVALAPFSSRIRHGFLRGAHTRQPGGGSRALQLAMRAAMARPLPPPASELRTLEAIVTLAAGSSAARRELIANHRTVLAPFLAGTGTGHQLRRELGPPPSADAPYEPLPPGGGVFDIRDWDDPDWFAFVRRHFGGDAGADWFARGEFIWERASILRLLQRHGLLERDSALLTASWGTDELAGMMADYAGVTQARLVSAPGGIALTDPEPGWLGSARLACWSARADARFDAIVLPRHALFSGKAAGRPERTEALLRRLAEQLRQGGRIVFSRFVDPANDRHPPDWGSGAGLRLVQPQRLSLSSASTERTRDWVIAGRQIPRTVSASDKTMLAEAVFVLEKPGRPGRD